MSLAIVAPDSAGKKRKMGKMGVSAADILEHRLPMIVSEANGNGKNFKHAAELMLRGVDEDLREMQTSSIESYIVERGNQLDDPVRKSKILSYMKTLDEGSTAKKFIKNLGKQRHSVYELTDEDLEEELIKYRYKVVAMEREKDRREFADTYAALVAINEIYVVAKDLDAQALDAQYSDVSTPLPSMTAGQKSLRDDSI
jgi:hypothetical protein